jgi:hypothetical protein
MIGHGLDHQHAASMVAVIAHPAVHFVNREPTPASNSAMQPMQPGPSLTHPTNLFSQAVVQGVTPPSSANMASVCVQPVVHDLVTGLDPPEEVAPVSISVEQSAYPKMLTQAMNLVSHFAEH